MNKLITSFTLLAFILIFTGCGKQTATVPAAGQQAGAGVVTDFIPDTGTYGTVTQCPVTGEKITVGKDTAALKYKGKTYYMCCPSCIKQFKENPEKYK